jgi:hypothetical protein
MYGITKLVNFLSLKEPWPILNNFDWYVIWIRRCFLLCVCQGQMLYRVLS